MVQQRIEDLRASLREALFLDLDEFGLEIQGDEVSSKFIGLRLQSVFQPISDASQLGGILGHEAFLRPSIGLEAVGPTFAFEFADKQGRLVKLDRIARTLHVLNFLNLPGYRGLLFLNVHPKLLTSVDAHGKVFERILHAYSVATQLVVIEVQESTIDTDKHLIEAVTNYRDRAYRIAIDGFGGRRTNIDRLWRIAPDFVKFDIGLVHEAETNIKARRVLTKLIEAAQEVGAQAIVQGIENETQRQIAIDAGANALQGYFFGRPAALGEWPANETKPAKAA